MKVSVIFYTTHNNYILFVFLHHLSIHPNSKNASIDFSFLHANNIIPFIISGNPCYFLMNLFTFISLCNKKGLHYVTNTSIHSTVVFNHFVLCRVVLSLLRSLNRSFVRSFDNSFVRSSLPPFLPSLLIFFILPYFQSIQHVRPLMQTRFYFCLGPPSFPIPFCRRHQTWSLLQIHRQMII